MGSCPPIKVPRFNVFPKICSTNEVEIWQRCSVSCDEGIEFIGNTVILGLSGYSLNILQLFHFLYMYQGPTDITECQPTGEWKDIEFMHCYLTCPARTELMNGYYENGKLVFGALYLV